MLEEKMSTSSQDRKRFMLITAAIAVVILIAISGVIWQLKGETGLAPSSMQTNPAENSSHADVSTDTNTISNKPILSQKEGNAKVGPQNEWKAKWSEVNQKAVTRLGSQFRVNLALGSVIFAVVAVLGCSIFAIYWFKLKKIRELPVAAPAAVQPGPEPVPKTNLLHDILQSSTASKVAWSLALFSSFVLFNVLFLDASGKLNAKHDVSLIAIAGALTTLTILSLLTGLWQLGAFVNLTFSTIFQTPATAWLIASFIAWLCCGAALFGVRRGTLRDALFYIIIGATKVLIASLLFGALGSIGGIYATIFAGIFMPLTYIAITFAYPYYDADEHSIEEYDKKFKAYRILSLVAIILAIVSTLPIYFGFGRGLLPFALMFASCSIIGVLNLWKRGTLVALKDHFSSTN